MWIFEDRQLLTLDDFPYSLSNKFSSLNEVEGMIVVTMNRIDHIDFTTTLPLSLPHRVRMI